MICGKSQFRMNNSIVNKLGRLKKKYYN